MRVFCLCIFVVLPWIICWLIQIKWMNGLIVSRKFHHFWSTSCLSQDNFFYDIWWLSNKVTIKLFVWTSHQRAPCGVGAPLFSPLSIYFLIFSPFYFSLSFIGFTYFLLLSIPSLSTKIAPLRFQAGGRRKRPNLGLACFLFVLSVFVS